MLTTLAVENYRSLRRLILPLGGLNEPETSLHPDLLPPLASLMVTAAKHTQLVAVTHSAALTESLAPHDPLPLIMVPGS